MNHFPGTFQIGRKDRLWKSLQKLMFKHGKHKCVLRNIQVTLAVHFVRTTHYEEEKVFVQCYTPYFTGSI